jgi:hypothetical protein
MDLDLVGHQSGALVAFVPPVLIEDRPLHWTLVRSQKDLLLSCHGF